jgi:hypothetical protein
MGKLDSTPDWLKHQRRATALLVEYQRHQQERHMMAAMRAIEKAVKHDKPKET